MLDGFTDERRDEREDPGHWRALEELGSIVRAVLLAATALAIGWLVSTWIDLPVADQDGHMHMTAS
jgi:hypothetical protein